MGNTKWTIWARALGQKSGTTDKDIIKELKDHVPDAEDIVERSEDTKPNFKVTTLPKDSINLSDELQLNFYNSSSVVTAVKHLIKKRRSIGWERSSPLHELRKLFGSYVATTEGIYISQKFLRHADASTTNDSYADVMANDNIKALWVA